MKGTLQALAQVLVVGTCVSYADAEVVHPNPPVDPKVAQADNACADYAAAFISNTERDYRDKLAFWRSLCEHHPVRLTCEDTQDTIAAMRKASPPAPLKCGQSPTALPSTPPGSTGGIKPLPPVDPKVAQADNACADYAAAFISNTERDYRDKLAFWRSLCEHHPVRLTCEDTQDTIAAMRKASPPAPLKCGQ